MKKFSLSCACLSLVVFHASVIAAPAPKQPQPTAAQIQSFSKLFCQRLQQGERFDTAMFRVMADLADQDESFALMLANDNSGFDKVGEAAFTLCPTAVGAGIERMPPKVRSAYFK